MKAKPSLSQAPHAFESEKSGSVCKAPARLTDNIWSSVFVNWLTPLLELGAKRPLDTLDLCEIPESFQAAGLTENLSQAWEKQALKPVSPVTGTRKNQLRSALFSVFGTTFMCAGLFLLAEFVNLSPPIILKSLMKFYTEKNPTSSPSPFEFVPVAHFVAFAAGLIFFLQISSIVTLNTYFMVTRYMGIKIRTALSGLIYQKSMKLSCASRQVIQRRAFNLLI